MSCLMEKVLLLAAVASGALLAFVAGSSARAEDIKVNLANPGFEEGSGGKVAAWEPANAGPPVALRWDRSIAHSGSASVSVEVPQEAAVGWPLWGQELPLPPDAVVLFLSARVRTRDVSDGHGAYIGIDYFDNKGDRITWSQSEGLKGTSDWVPLSVIGAVPPGTRRIRVNLLLHGHGKAWFDDVALEARIQVQEKMGPEGVIALSRRTKVCDRFMGFGVENNPFLFTSANRDVTEETKHALEEYIRFLRPRIVRIFLDTKWWDPMGDGQYIWNWQVTDLLRETEPYVAMQALYRVLDLYRGMGVPVNLVMWRPTDWSEAQLPQMVGSVADLLQYLVREKGYDNVQFLTLYNEPDNEFRLSTGTYVKMYHLISDALKKRGLNIGLVGADTTHGGDRFFREVSDGIGDVVAGFSYHEYIRYGTPVLGPLVHMEAQLEQVKRVVKGKPLIVWEFNIQGKDAGTFTPGRGDSGAPILDEFPSALQLAEYIVGALGRGIAGMCYWEAYDMNYPGNNRMEYGLIANEGDQLRLRPFFYVYQLFTRLIEPGASVFAVDAGGAAGVSSVLIENPDGDVTLFVVNQGEGDLEFDVKSVLSDTAAAVSRVGGGNKLSYALRLLDEEEAGRLALSGEAEVPARELPECPEKIRVPARSLAALTVFCAGHRVLASSLGIPEESLDGEVPLKPVLK